MGALRRKFPRQPLPTKDKIPHNECRRGTPTNVSLCRYRFIALSLSKRNADRFARSEQDWADVAVETSGFVLRASCFCEFVQFLLDFVRPDGVQHLHDLITRGANYERRLRLKYASTEAARLAPDSIPEPASMPATTKVQLLHHIRVITSVDHLVRDDWGGEGFWPPFPPNRTGDFPAYGSPVDGFPIGAVSLAARPCPG